MTSEANKDHSEAEQGEHVRALLLPVHSFYSRWCCLNQSVVSRGPAQVGLTPDRCIKRMEHSSKKKETVHGTSLRAH